MPYGVIKVDQVTFTNAGVDQTISVSGIVASISGNITATGTISGDVIRGGTTVSGATVTGTAGRFGTVTGNTAGFTTVTGTTVTGTTASFTSGVFTSISGGTYTITSGVFASGTAAAPSITFAGDLDTGVYASATNQVSITTSGTERLRIDATGQIEAASLGTAAAPAYSFTADPDTGVYSPGTNQLAISTAGTGRLFVDANGNVGVGTGGTQSSKFHVEGTSRFVGAPSAIFNGTTGTYSTWLYNETSVGDIGTSNQVFSGGANTDFAITSRGATALVFGTNATERMRIDSSGRVGIGTSSPGVKLHIADGQIRVANSGAINPSIEFTGNGAGASGFQIGQRYNAQELFIYDSAAASDRAVITSTGKVGIGTSSPDANSMLTVFNASNASYRAQNNVGGAAIFGVTDSTASEGFINASNAWRLRVDGTTRASLTSTGLGIGTTSPVTLLHLAGNADQRFTNTTNTAGFDIGLLNGTGSAESYVFNRANAALVFGTNNAERARIDSSGRLGIGTSSPGAVLHAVLDSADCSAIFKSSNYGAEISLDSGIGYSAIKYLASGTEKWRVGQVGQTTNFQIYQSGVGDRLVIDSSGRLLVGTSAARSNIAGVSPGIQLEGANNNTPRSFGQIYGKSDAAGPLFLLAKHRSDSVGGQTVVSSGDELGQIVFTGSDGSNFVQGASIKAEVDGTPGANDMPGRLVFSTTADGASSPTERMRITSAGNVGIGTTSPVYPLSVLGPGATSGRVYLGNSLEGLASGANNGGAIYFGVDPTSATAATAAIESSWGGSTNPQIHMGVTRDGNKTRFSAFSDFTARIYTGNNERVRIDSNGQFNLSSNASSAPFVVNIGASEVSRIDSSGRLLVGTSTSVSSSDGFTPAIQVAGSSGLAAASVARFSGDAFPPQIQLQKSRGSIGTQGVVSSGDALGSLMFEGSDGTVYKAAARISAEVDGTPGANDMPGRLVFSTTADGASSPTERMRIASNGEIQFGNTANGAYTVTRNSGICAYFDRRTSDGVVISFEREGTGVGNISVTTTATAYNTSSDYRLKENVTAVTDGITRLQQLKPSRFNFIADPDTVVDGFIAHEVQSVVPEAITGEKDAVDDEGNPQYQGIDQSKLVPLLTAALQEAIAKIETLEARLTAAGL